jgi:hypothetical protein
MEAVLFLKSKHAHSMVEVKDLQSEDATAVALRCGRRYETLDATRGPGCPRSSSLTGGWIGYLIAGFIGACILIAIARAFSGGLQRRT